MYSELCDCHHNLIPKGFIAPPNKPVPHSSPLHVPPNWLSVSIICILGTSRVSRIFSDFHVISAISLFFLNIYLIFHMTVSFSRCSPVPLSRKPTWLLFLAALGFLQNCCYRQIPIPINTLPSPHPLCKYRQFRRWIQHEVEGIFLLLTEGKHYNVKRGPPSIAVGCSEWE